MGCYMQAYIYTYSRGGSTTTTTTTPTTTTTTTTTKIAISTCWRAMVGEYITIPKDNIKARDVKLYVLARTMLSEHFYVRACNGG